MKKGLLLLLVGASLLVGACSADHDKPSKTVADGATTTTQSEFEAYLKFKHLKVADNKQRKALKDQFLEREAIASLIEKEGILDQQMINVEIAEFRKEMLISRYFEKFLHDKVGENEVRNYYATHSDEFGKRKVHVSHILLRTTRNMGEIERKVKLTTAMEAYSRVKAGENFADVALALSEDKNSAKKGGDLGWLQEGSIDSRFSAKVFAMGKGDLSEPFETAFGYHVVHIEEESMKVVRPFETVQGDIRYQLRNQYKNEEIKRLRSKAGLGNS